jgi:predicted PurR-regulated permease PerM
MSEPNPSAARHGDRSIRAMLAVGTAILVLTALYLARPIFAPLAFALFVIAVVWPVQAWLARRLPTLVALALSMLATIVVLWLFVSLIAWGFSRVGRYVVTDAARFTMLYTQVAVWLEGHDIVLGALWAEHFNVGWVIRAFQQVTLRINGLLSFSVVVMIYVILGLLEVGPVAAKLRAMGQAEAARVLLDGSTRAAVKLRRYILVRTLMSAMTGLLVWGFILACGLPLATEWGVMAFAFNYIPFIGPLVATVLPTLFAVVQFEAWQMALMVFAALNLIQFLVGSYLEPRIAGSILAMSPFLVLFTVFFWMFLWGIAGAFIGVPIVIVLLTLCEQHPSSRWIAVLFGAPDGKPA